MSTPLLWAVSVMTIGTVTLSFMGAVWTRLRPARSPRLVVPPLFAVFGLTATVLVWIILFVEYSRPGFYPSPIPLVLAGVAVPVAMFQSFLRRRRR